MILLVDVQGHETILLSGTFPSGTNQRKVVGSLSRPVGVLVTGTTLWTILTSEKVGTFDSVEFHFFVPSLS